jgi:hypothetical protein
MMHGSGLRATVLRRAGWPVLGERWVFESVEPAVFTKPARHALWVGSSYCGTRNRHPPTGHTPLVTVEKSNDPDSGRRAFWLPGMGSLYGSRPSHFSARQPQGVTADFWYPSMRRATPAAATQRRPNEVSELRQHRSPQQQNGHKVKGFSK